MKVEMKAKDGGICVVLINSKNYNPEKHKIIGGEENRKRNKKTGK